LLCQNQLAPHGTLDCFDQGPGGLLRQACQDRRGNQRWGSDLSLRLVQLRARHSLLQRMLPLDDPASFAKKHSDLLLGQYQPY
jgi:hypothetical protein